VTTAKGSITTTTYRVPNPGENPFGDMLTRLWEERGIHQAEFCRRIHAPAGWVQQIREGKKSPPLGRVSKWADVLDLTGPKRALFLDLAAVMHLPREVRAHFAELIRDAQPAASRKVAAAV
jgi:transcriptional regulator with XRE-family HTH domain